MSQPPKPATGRSSFRPAVKTAPPPTTRPLAESLAGNAGLGGLMARVRESEARLQVVRAIVPPELGGRLRAGPLDDEGWTLLAANAAVAAKLRHLMPTIEDAMRERGWAAVPLRVRVSGAG